MPSEVPAFDSNQSSVATDRYHRNIGVDQHENFIDETTELPDDYGPGKLHPVQFGDVFKDVRYKVLRKLGAGSFSTVWLARDRRLNKYVALKIATAQSSATEHESIILAHLSRQQHQHPGQIHVTMLLDSFEHRGPNGLHRCLVFDVMGPNSSAMFNYLPSNWHPPLKSGEPSKNRGGRLAFWIAKSVIRQILLGIDFLHKNGIAHGDLQPGNILFSVKDLSTFRESNLAQADLLGKTFAKKINEEGEVDFQHLTTGEKDAEADVYTQRHINGKPDPSAPRYIVPKEPMFKYVDFEPPLLVKISDLGGAFFISEPPAKPVTPLALRSPELILGEPISKAQDIWSFGCLMFEFLTGKSLFSVMPPMPSGWGDEMFSEDNDAISDAPIEENKYVETTGDEHRGFDNDTRKDAVCRDHSAEENDEGAYDENDELTMGTDDSTDDDHVLQMADLLGPVPSSFMAKFPRSCIYFDDKGDVTKHYVGELIEEDDINHILILPRIETFLDQEKGADINSEDAAIVKELLRLILQFDPAERPTAETLLAHPWFTKPVADV